jgi:CBS domain containing-hemolysin-like protein
MTVEQLEIISLVAYILAGVFLVLAFILFWALHIGKIINDLTGKTARRRIAQIQAKNGMMDTTSQAEAMHKMDFGSSQSGALASVTEPLQTETVLLGEQTRAGETVLLEEQQEDSDETVLLYPERVGIHLVRDITFIHTNETIE